MGIGNLNYLMMGIMLQAEILHVANNQQVVKLYWCQMASDILVNKSTWWLVAMFGERSMPEPMQICLGTDLSEIYTEVQ